VAGRLKRGRSILASVLCMAVASTAVAQALRDPTRPAAGSSRAAAGKTGQSGWVLQSVLISPERRYAIINGEVVAVGESISGAQLIAVAAERVTLRTREGLRVLQLFPDVTRLDIESTNAETRATISEAEKDTKAQRSGMTK
jgi:MSHA biogenesis protein MshK